MSKAFSAIERDFIKLIERTQQFNFQGVEYTTKDFGKPFTAKGECKTDIYLSGVDSNRNLKEIKISIKKTNANFLENKIKLERAKELFGVDYKCLLVECINSIKHSFEREPLIRIHQLGRVEAKTISLGWKFEILNIKSGEKSDLMHLTREQKKDIYAGTNLSIAKKNSYVDNCCITNSGVAEYMLSIDTISQNLDFYLDKLVAIDDFIIDEEFYFACKALNYRSEKDKWDGDRPLAVYVDWTVTNKKLSSQLVYDQPLEKKGNEIGRKLQAALKQINITSSNFEKIADYYDGKIH